MRDRKAAQIQIHDDLQRSYIGLYREEKEKNFKRYLVYNTRLMYKITKMQFVIMLFLYRNKV